MLLSRSSLRAVCIIALVVFGIFINPHERTISSWCYTAYFEGNAPRECVVGSVSWKDLAIDATLIALGLTALLTNARTASLVKSSKKTVS